MGQGERGDRVGGSGRGRDRVGGPDERGGDRVGGPDERGGDRVGGVGGEGETGRMGQGEGEGDRSLWNVYLFICACIRK